MGRLCGEYFMAFIAFIRQTSNTITTGVSSLTEIFEKLLKSVLVSNVQKKDY